MVSTAPQKCGMVFFMAIAAHAAIGQGSWTFNYQASGVNSVLRDAIELDNGKFMLALNTSLWVSAEQDRSYLLLLDNGGALEQVVGLRWTDLRIGISGLVPSDTSSTIHALGSAADTLQAGGVGFVHYQVDPTLTLLDSARFIFDTLNVTSLDNGCLDQDGNIYLVGGASIASSASTRMFQLLKLSQTGDSITSNLLGSDSGFTSPHQSIPYNGNMLVATEGGGGDVGPSGVGRFLQFDSQLQYVTGFSSLSLNGTGSISPVDSVMRFNMSLYALPNGCLIMAGVWGNWWPDGYRVVVSKLTGTGEQIQHFFPRSDLYADFAAHLSGVEKIGEGSFLFGMLEGFSASAYAPLQSLSPSRVHIFRMDTSLNVLCDFVVDGFTDSTYYYLQRVKSTSDGGTLLIGSRQDLSVPGSLPIAWVQKLGPDDCNVGIAHSERPTAQVFPNPGSKGFTLLLNGPAVSGGRLVLADAQGRQVAEVAVWNSSVQVIGDHLINGMYFYRVLDNTGTPITSGKWVKN